EQATENRCVGSSILSSATIFHGPNKIRNTSEHAGEQGWLRCEPTVFCRLRALHNTRTRKTKRWNDWQAIFIRYCRGLSRAGGSDARNPRLFAAVQRCRVQPPPLRSSCLC